MAEEPLALALARRICGLRIEDVGDHALRQAKTCLIDAIGVTLAGAHEEAVRILMRTPGVADAPGPCLLWGTRQRTSSLDAALINGTASHALDYDDFSAVFGGHHTVPLMSALFAVAEERGLSGRELLVAYVAGVETEIRFARAVHFHHYDKGWHPTSTLGVFGAAAAVSRVIGLDPERTATALAIAASHASGLKANFGTMTKPLHAGQCGRHGLLAVLLAEAGFEANPEALEHEQGFLNAFNGPGRYQVAPLREAWAQPFAIEGDHIALKQYPCCGSTHAAIVAMLTLANREAIRPEQVAAIEVFLHERRLRHTDNPMPATPAEAKFSVQYVAVRALLSGGVQLRHFEDEAHAQPVVRELLARTRASPFPDMADDAAQQWGAEVRLQMRDGRRLRHAVDRLVGAVGELRDEDLWEKFADCASRALPAARTRPIFERLRRLEGVPDVREVTQLLES
jgi:2-methylcitrate dehydratase PrpD